MFRASALIVRGTYLLLALIYAVTLISTDDLNRNALLDAPVEVEKDPAAMPPHTGFHCRSWLFASLTKVDPRFKLLRPSTGNYQAAI
jgi:hypothetical protein